MKTVLKSIINSFAMIVVAPLSIASRLEELFFSEASGIFDFSAHTLALIPGLPGVYLRRAFYRAALEYCARDACIMFGVFFSRRSARVESGAYVGAYTIIGSVCLEPGCLVGSRASLLSGGQLHHFEGGRWSAADFSDERQIRIGEGAWLGEGVIVMADVGRGSMVGAGSIVSSAVKDYILVAGNPARFLRNLESPQMDKDDNEEAKGGQLAGNHVVQSKTS